MHGELDALLSLQASDLRVADLERQLDALLPRLRDLEWRRREKAEAIEKVEATARVEERRRHDLQRRLAQHRQLQERNEAQLESVRNVREAGAATAQLDVTRRIVAEDEQELRTTDERITALQVEADSLKGELTDLDQEMEAAHADVAEQRAQLELDLVTARADRAQKAGVVSRPLLGKYERIRGKRASALYPVRGQSCGHCDTAVPLHRRSEMQASGGIEVCEACGVLLYMGTGA